MADGASGAAVAQATGVQVHAPLLVRPARPTTVTTLPAPQIAPVAVTGPAQPAAPTLPRDGFVLLLGILLIGLVVSLRAIRGRQRRLGLALLGFCTLYLIVLGGILTGVAGAAPAPPSNVAAIPGDNEVLLTFDPPPPGITITIDRGAGQLPSSCADTTKGRVVGSGITNGSFLDTTVTDAATYDYLLCSVENQQSSPPTQLTGIVPTSALSGGAPRSVTGLKLRRSKVNVLVSWQPATDPTTIGVVVVRRQGSAPASITDGVVIFQGDAADAATVDHPPPGKLAFYGVFAVNGQGNASAAAVASVVFNPPLRSPYDSQVVHGRVLLSWRPVRGAGYYDVQLYRGVCCAARVMDAHPHRASQATPSLRRRSTYIWYVWAHVRPGSSPSSFRFLGAQTFNVA